MLLYINIEFLDHILLSTAPGRVYINHVYQINMAQVKAAITISLSFFTPKDSEVTI